MLAIGRVELNKVAEQLACLHKSVTDANGKFVCFPVSLDRYPAAVMAALVSLSDGEAIGYQGDTHLKGYLPGQSPESFTLDNPKKPVAA